MGYSEAGFYNPLQNSMTFQEQTQNDNQNNNYSRESKGSKKNDLVLLTAFDQPKLPSKSVKTACCFELC